MGRLFAVSGRAGRSQYWLTILALLAVSVVLVMLAFSVLSTTDLASLDLSPGALAVALVAAIAYLGVLGIGLAVTVRRLHDRDKSGWWLLLFYLVPALLERVAAGSDATALVALPLSFAVSVWALVELGFLRGTPGPNRFGPDPAAS